MKQSHEKVTIKEGRVTEKQPIETKVHVRITSSGKIINKRGKKEGEKYRISWKSKPQIYSDSGINDLREN